ncbi:hypothetical protein HMPREF9140_02060 [Prevotella micans F0438]|uniref:Uncharacterized protein n=2 Tax=Prevotella micans F0438 TaxID=883158 RepID=H1Q572_9BACT|nr:hypothetical protein HMPREF9140_02060 [Prevotella micans F0438]
MRWIPMNIRSFCCDPMCFAVITNSCSTYLLYSGHLKELHIPKHVCHIHQEYLHPSKDYA